MEVLEFCFPMVYCTYYWNRCSFGVAIIGLLVVITLPRGPKCVHRMSLILTKKKVKYLINMFEVYGTGRVIIHKHYILKLVDGRKYIFKIPKRTDF